MKKLSESAWGDMRHRSSGKVIRKEDDVNHMDFDTFAEYIKDTYSEKGDWFSVVEGPTNSSRHIEIDIITGITLSFNEVDGKIYNILVQSSNKYVDVPGLKKVFNVNVLGSSTYSVSEKDWTKSNNTFVKLIEFFLDKKTNESAWGEMRKRSSGEQIRKEDDVNLLDLDGLYDYIKSKYEKRLFYLDKDTFGKNNKRNIVVDVIANISLFTNYNKSGKFDHILLSWTKVKIAMPFFDKLKERFNVQMPNVNRRTITEKDGTCTNQTYVDVIDFFLDNIDNMLVNESAWGDMRKRSSGEQIRKEDEMTEADFDALNDCIFEFATRVVWDNWKYSRESFCKCVQDYTGYSTTGEKANVGNILKYVNSHWTELNTELDDAIEKEQNEKDEGMNESAWGDMRKKSSGEEIRREEFTEEFIDKVKSDLIGFTMLVVNYIENYELTFDGFYKYLEEIEYPDEVKKIIYYVKTHKDECDKLLEKDIKFENKLLDEKVNAYLLRFIDNIVYDEKYHNTLSDIKKFASEIFKGHKSSYNFHINKKLVFKDKSELFNDYIEDKWKDGSLKQKIDDFIKNENDKISKYGFIKEPGKTISETVDDWWHSLDEDKRNDLGWDEFGDDAEEEYYTDHNPNFNEYTGEDFDADEWWDNAYGIRRVKIYCSEHSKTNESAWGDMRKKSSGEEIRKEDDVLTDMEINALNEFTLMYCRGERAHYIQNHIVPPPPSRRKENDYEGLIKYIEDRRDENLFTNVGDYDKIIRYIKKNWDRLDMDTYIKKYICSPSVMKGKKIVECEGVPGGITPADVGGMGAAYFPGPNGEPGSGDLPSPTGIVYHQVAPYTMFLKQIKKKKKKTKKFRKEDEPCVHSENPPIYSHVDDFRDYVDRVYNQIDRKK